MKKLIVVCSGLPASGKTSFIHQLITSVSNSTIYHISFDDLISTEEQIILSSAPHSSSKRWCGVRSQILQDLEAHIIAGGSNDLVILDKKVDSPTHRNTDRIIYIVDDNNYYRSMRYQYYQLARRQTTGFCQIHFDSNLETSLSYNAKRVNPIPNEVIIRMSGVMQKPSGANFWERFSYEVPHFSEDSYNESSIVDDILNLLETAIDCPVIVVSEKNESLADMSREGNLKNIVHNADIQLRKCIGDLHKNGKINGSFASNLSRVSRIKRDMLDELRKGISYENIEVEFLDRLNSTL